MLPEVLSPEYEIPTDGIWGTIAGQVQRVEQPEVAPPLPNETENVNTALASSEKEANISYDRIRTQEAIDGDQEAFASLFMSYSGMMKRIIGRVVPEHAVEDVMMEMYINAARANSRQGFEDRGEGFEPWLATIARRTSLSWYKTNKRHAQPIDPLHFTMLHQASAEPTPEQEVVGEKGDYRDWLKKTIGKLAARDEQPLSMELIDLVAAVFLDEMPREAYAAEKDINRATVNTRINRMRQKVLADLRAEMVTAGIFDAPRAPQAENEPDTITIY